MDLATELAQTCVAAQKQADAPADIRNQFEALSSKEKLLRSQAGRYSELAKGRADEEDQSLGGYAGTAASRMLPIPHTLSEAAVRLPAIGAGVLGGYHYGKQFEPLGGDALKSLFVPGTGGKGGQGTMPAQAVTNQMFAHSYAYPEQEALAEALLKSDPAKANELDTYAKGRGVDMQGATSSFEAIDEMNRRKAHLDSIQDPALKAQAAQAFAKKPVKSPLGHVPGMTAEEYNSQVYKSPGQEGLADVALRAARTGEAPGDLASFGKSQGVDISEYKNMLRHLSERSPEELQNIFQKKFAPPGLGLSREPTPGEAASRAQVEGVLGEGSIGKLHDTLKSMIGQAKKPTNVVESLTPHLSGKGIRGAIGMGGTAALLSGLPYAVRALWQKHQGGEAAVRARQEAKGRLEQAGQLPAEREKLLQQLQGLKTAAHGVIELKKFAGVPILGKPPTLMKGPRPIVLPAAAQHGMDLIKGFPAHPPGVLSPHVDPGKPDLFSLLSRVQQVPKQSPLADRGLWPSVLSSFSEKLP